MRNSTATSGEQQEGQQEQQDQEQGEDETAASKAVDVTVVVDPLSGLTESERLSLVIRFGAANSGGMCAAMSHGHSFQSSIFRLPAKCAGCHELVWGPFTRGCTCLTCSITVHRSCTGIASMPPCSRKNVFDAFCRSELGLPPRPLARCATNDAVAAAAAAGSTPASTGDGGRKDASGGGAAPNADLDEWATVEGTSAHSTSAGTTAEVRSSPVPPPPPQEQQPPASASCAVQDLGSSFFWSPLGFGQRKRPLSADTNEQQQCEVAVAASAAAQDSETEPADDAGDAAGSSSPGTTSPDEQSANGAAPSTQLAATTTTHDAPGSNGTIGIGGVTKLSVAGGVVGALFGGPVGAVVGLNFGAVLGAGRSVQQGLWQRIEKNRREAGAEGIGLRKAAAAAEAATTALVEEEEAARKPQDTWERIAKRIEGEHQPVVWYVLGLQEVERANPWSRAGSGASLL